jgi:hypothetical protein
LDEVVGREESAEGVLEGYELGVGGKDVCVVLWEAEEFAVESGGGGRWALLGDGLEGEDEVGAAFVKVSY